MKPRIRHTNRMCSTHNHSSPNFKTDSENRNPRRSNLLMGSEHQTHSLSSILLNNKSHAYTQIEKKIEAASILLTGNCLEMVQRISFQMALVGCIQKGFFLHQLYLLATMHHSSTLFARSPKSFSRNWKLFVAKVNWTT